jgi:hypothetical protein
LLDVIHITARATPSDTEINLSARGQKAPVLQLLECTA